MRPLVVSRLGKGLLGLLLLLSACATAPKSIGNRDPDAPIDINQPEVNCKLYTTVDCRTPTSW